MGSVRRYIAVALLLLQAMLMALALPRADAVETGPVRLAFQPGDGHLVDLSIGGDSASAASKSLLTKDAAGNLLSDHFGLEGPALEKAQWALATSPQTWTLSTTDDAGRLRIRKTLTATGTYRFHLTLSFQNISASTIDFPEGVFLQLGPGLGEYPAARFGLAEKLYSYVQPVLATGARLQRIDLAEEGRKPTDIALGALDWFGLHSRYFALLLSPSGTCCRDTQDIRVRWQAGQKGLPARYLPVLTANLGLARLDPQQTQECHFDVFAGPKSFEALRTPTHDYRGLVFSGLPRWMRGLCAGVLWLLKAIQTVIPNWGLAILVLALLIRLALYPFARKMLLAQRQFADFQQSSRPEMQRIKAQYKGAEQSERILQLYKTHGMSPFSGLKPLLIVLVQLPVFMALFHVLGRAYELMNASFLWIPSLAAPDQTIAHGIPIPFLGPNFNVLPLLMAASSIATIALAPSAAADGTKSPWHTLFLSGVAIGFFVLFYAFPSGMVLYWTMANLLQLAQQFLSGVPPR